MELYTPLLCSWARALGLQEADAADLVQDVYQLLVRKLPEFRYDQRGRFRAWLHAVLVNRWRTLRRGRPGAAAAGPAPDAPTDDHTEALIEADYRQYLVGRALRVMQSDFQPSTWRAFREQACNGRPAAEVAAELSISFKAAYLARARVLRRLREELDGLRGPG